MILPFITGYVLGRFMRKRLEALVTGILVGAAIGLLATYTLVPLLYPIFTGDAGLVVIPEFDSIGIMFLLPDFIIYTETVYMFTRSYIIDLTFLLTGCVFTAIGTYLGARYKSEIVTQAFTES